VVEDATRVDLFLQKVSLVADVDRHDRDANALTLMTLHNAKGLEFPVVFLSGLEDGLFPLSRSIEQAELLEEERRLFYVGLTRAEQKVYLTHARSRRRAGAVLDCKPSSFLDPIPARLVEQRPTPLVARLRGLGELSSGRRSTFRDDRVGDVFGGRPARGGDGNGSSGTRQDAGGWSVPRDADDLPRFVKGERIRHPQFGPGTIRELTGFGRDLKAVVDFESVGRKKVLLRAANLQKER
jgi:DNA helicase II / ATP-dependent DNA helicase PcrA